jgi:NADPH:quinone reductase-like Zn-dependent oxidoreductase
MDSARSLLQSLSAPLPATRNLATLLAACVLLQQLNRILSGYVLNNWTSDTYDWPRELVLLTGGSSGIGKSVAAALARRGVKVIVADVLEPAEPLRMPPLSVSHQG